VVLNGDRTGPLRATIVFTDEDGRAYEVPAAAEHPDVGVRYGLGLSPQHDGDFPYYVWKREDTADFLKVEAKTIASHQLMRFEMDGMTDYGVFELLVEGDRYRRYPNW
jgi:hypothetical protein